MTYVEGFVVPVPAAKKEEFRRHGIFGSNHQRSPAARLDDVSRGQLAGFLDTRLGRV